MFYYDIQRVLNYNYLQTLSLILLFFPLSASPLCSFLHPAHRVWLLTIKNIYEIHIKTKRRKRRRGKEKKLKCHTFPILSLFPQFSLSGF